MAMTDEIKRALDELTRIRSQERRDAELKEELKSWIMRLRNPPTVEVGGTPFLPLQRVIVPLSRADEDQLLNLLERLLGRWQRA